MLSNPLKVLQDQKKQHYLSDWIVISDILPDNKTCVTQNGTLVQVLKLGGLDYTSLSVSERESLFAQRKSFFERIDEDIELSVFACRRKINTEKVVPFYGQQYAQEIANKVADNFVVSFETEIYVVIKKKVKKVSNVINIGSKNFAKEQAVLMGRASSFSAQVEVIQSGLEKFKPTLLSHNDEYSDLLAFWSYVLNGGQQPTATTKNTNLLNYVLGYSDVEFIPREPIALFKKLKSKFKEYKADKALYEETVNLVSEEVAKGNHSYIRFSCPNETRFASMLFLKYYPQMSDDKLFDNLLSLQKEFVFIQHFQSTNKDIVLEKTNLFLNQLRAFGRFVERHIFDVEDFADGISADLFQQINHSMHIMVFGDSTTEVDSGVNAISSSLAGRGINIKREEGKAEQAYWSMLPDYEVFASAREVPITTETAADFCTFGAKPFGNHKCSFGDYPVSMFKTTDGQSYGFTFHPTPDRYVAGSCLVVGKSGSGKTFTTAYLISQCLKYKGYGEEGRFKGLIFDSLNGLKVPVNALDGNYVDIADEEGFIPLNPLQMPDNGTNRAFLERWIESLAGDVKAQERENIKRAVRACYDDFDKDQRNLHNLRIAFGIDGYEDNGDARLLQKLKPWLPNADDPTKSDYSYGMFFNAEKDALDFDKQLIGFDMTFLNDNKELLVPLTNYLFHRFTDYINNNPCPHLWFIDEAFKFIENPIIYPHIRTALKEWRKRNGIVIAAIQELETLNSIDVGQEFLGGFDTYILFKDATASPENYLGKEGRAGVGLNETEFNWIKSYSGGKREVMIKRKSGESIILDIDLSVLGKHRNLLRSEKEVISRYHNLRNEENWQELLMESF